MVWTQSTLVLAPCLPYSLRLAFVVLRAYYGRNQDKKEYFFLKVYRLVFGNVCNATCIGPLLALNFVGIDFDLLRETQGWSWVLSSTISFQWFQATFGRVWTQIVLVLHPGTHRNSLWMDLVVLRDSQGWNREKEGMSRFGELVSYFLVTFAQNLHWLSLVPYVDVGITFWLVEGCVMLVYFGQSMDTILDIFFLIHLWKPCVHIELLMNVWA